MILFIFQRRNKVRCNHDRDLTGDKHLIKDKFLIEQDTKKPSIIICMLIVHSTFRKRSIDVCSNGCILQ